MTKAKEQDNLINELHANLHATKEDFASKDKENQKLQVALNQLRDKCFVSTSRCCDNMKKIFSSASATSKATSFTSGGTEGALGWIEKELSKVENFINARSDYCAMIGSSGMASVLEKAGCDHVKVIREDGVGMDVEDIKVPSKSIISATKKFFFELWNKGGRQFAVLEDEEYTRKVCPWSSTAEA